MTRIGLGLARAPASRTTLEQALEVQADDRLSRGASARRSRWAAPAAASRTTRTSSSRCASAGSTLSPDARDPDRGIAPRLERVRDGGRARPQGQLHHRLLDREPRSDGRAHRRLDHRRAGADADRQGIPDHARRVDRGAARDRRRHRRLERAVRDQSGRRPHDRHRDEPARVAQLGARVEGDRLPDREGRGEARGRLHARRAAERHHRGRDAGVVRADDRLRRHQGAALRVREVQAGRRPAHDADEVGRRGDGDRPHVPGVAAEGAARPRDGRGRLQPEDASIRTRSATSSRIRAPSGSGTSPTRSASACRSRSCTATRRSIRGSSRRSRRSSTSSSRLEQRTLADADARRAARAEAQGLRRSAPRAPAEGRPRPRCARAGMRSGMRPVYKRVDTCAAEFATQTAYLYSTYEEECEAAADRPEEGDRAGRRAEPHRAGHRVRLLLRARGDGAARGRLRDDHGQLQPGDGVDRLRHVGPAVLRAAHARGRARDRARREAVGRDRAVRRADAAQARARPRDATACRSSARRPT